MARLRSQLDTGSGRRAEAYRLAAVALRAGRGRPVPWAGKYNPAVTPASFKVTAATREAIRLSWRT